MSVDSGGEHWLPCGRLFDCCSILILCWTIPVQLQRRVGGENMAGAGICCLVTVTLKSFAHCDLITKRLLSPKPESPKTMDERSVFGHQLNKAETWKWRWEWINTTNWKGYVIIVGLLTFESNSCSDPVNKTTFLHFAQYIQINPSQCWIPRVYKFNQLCHSPVLLGSSLSNAVL